MTAMDNDDYRDGSRKFLRGGGALSKSYCKLGVGLLKGVGCARCEEAFDYIEKILMYRSYSTAI